MKRIASYIILSFILVVSISSESRCVTMTDYNGNPAAMSAYSSIPPFLTVAVEPNLLLMIDNSASMYDLAYVNDQKYCYDDSYDPASTYAGYCESETYYKYDETDGQFEPTTQAAAEAFVTGATGTKYANTDVGIAIDETATPNVVTAFAAKGNYLNWAMASKLDIEKEILTGGKYEAAGTYGAPNGRLVMESRGCLDRRFLKQVAVMDAGSNTFYLALGVGSPQEERFPPWTVGTTYQVGDIVTDFGDLYRATAVTGPSTGAGVADDTGATWEAYTLTRWTDGASYPANSIVSDNGKMYITATGGTASGTGVADDAGITDWVEYNVTQIEIFPVTTTGFDNSGCQLAVEELGKTSPNQGLLMSYINSCMGYVSGGGPSEEADSIGAFNHAIHNCWYEVKNGEWPPGAGPETSIKYDCEHLYTIWGTDPWDITTDNQGYVCFGVYDSDSGTSGLQPLGYVGRCWKPGTGYFQCTKTNPNTGECQKWVWVGSGGTPAWDAAGYADVDTCIQAALMDYCGMIEIPEVVDPTDQAGETGEFWNIPAVLIDSGVIAQIGVPLVSFKGYIEQSTAPTGIIQEFAEDLRLGVMNFNNDGTNATECSALNPDPTHIVYPCTYRDGGQITAYLDKSTSHTNTVVAAINDIKASSWTPIAEAMYNAIGYFTQDTDRRLNTADWDSTQPDPVTVWCQSNNVLIITDGSSTADQASFPEALSPSDGDTDPASSACSTLSGSTRFDDLTYYAKHGGAAIFTTPQTDGQDKQNIETHIVVAGTPRDSGTTDECNPKVLLENAASNSGTPLYTAENPSQLESKIREALWAIVGAAGSGTAASVVSAARKGEGAIYQAVFYRILKDISGAEINWAGQLHGLFVDEYGNMREDSDGDETLNLTNDDIIVLYFDPVDASTKAIRDTDSDGDGVPDGSPVNILLSDVNYMWEAGKALAERDLATNDRVIHTSINGAWTEFKDTNASLLRPYLAQSTDADAANLINYLRGTEQTGYRNRTISMDGTDRVWRLGDIVYSTPTAVGKPMERYDLIYHDRSYRAFKTAHHDRRNVVYVGANDGMLHAFNAGTYNQTLHKYTTEADKPLGMELWAYVPYNVLPHLQWLKDPNYSHVCYVDLKPKVTDAKIFSADSTHVNGWGTVLICGMRFGGGEISVTDDFGAGSETKTFRSAYIAFDITDPDNPEFMWEFTDANLGFTTSYPAVVGIDRSSDPDNWYIAIGSGPTDLDGTSTQGGRTFVVDLATGTCVYSYTTSVGSAFMGDPISVDVDINNSQCTDTGCTYNPDVAYVGNTEGKFYRLLPSGTTDVFLDLGPTKPITSEANASQDEDGRLWIYFGTGKFISNADKTNTEIQSLVGVKEPYDWGDCDTNLTLTINCATPTNPSLGNLLDVTNITVYEGGHVEGHASGTFEGLVNDIKQDNSGDAQYDGWIMDIPAGERCMAEPTVLGGIVTFTTFRPDSHVCAFEGESFGYPLFYKTGTAPYVNVIGYGDSTWTDGDGQTHKEISRRVYIGQGVAATPSLHIGDQEGAKAFIQCSTGEIRIIQEMNLMEGYRSRPLYWIQPAD